VVLVAVVFLSPSMDAARAGWHHRRTWRAETHGCVPEIVADRAAVSVPVDWAQPAAQMAWDLSHEPSCCEPVACCGDVLADRVETGCGEHWLDENAGAILTSEPWRGNVADEEILSEHPIPGESVPLGFVAGELVEEHLAEPLALTPELVPAVMEEENATQEITTPESSVLMPEGRSDVVDEPDPSRSEPVVHEPLRMESADSAAETEAPAEPALPATEPEPINIFEAEEGGEASREPVRRWIHSHGDRSIVARLVGRPDAASCLLEIGSRRLMVPLDNLSDHDRAYVDRVGERLAESRRAARPGDTAGL
jgi:hypothetical protein